jgi:hypothetical protein
MTRSGDGQFLPFISAVFLSLAVAWAVLLFTPLPKSVKAQPVKTVSWIKTDKAPDRVPQRPVTTVSYRLDAPVKKASLAELVNAPWPCAQIRQAVEKYGRDAVKRFARAQGYTKKQIDEAMACVAEKRTDARCDGPARYEAMREAFEAGLPQPC